RPPGRVRDGERRPVGPIADAPGRGVPAGRPGGAADRPGARGAQHAGAAGGERPVSLSLNQWTTRRRSLPAAVDGCARHGLEAIGLWREKVAETGLARSAKLVREAGLRVSSLCRGGFLTAGGLPGEEGRRAFAEALDDNRRAVDEAAELGAARLVRVGGGLPGVRPREALAARVSRAVPRARGRVAG